MNDNLLKKTISKRANQLLNKTRRAKLNALFILLLIIPIQISNAQQADLANRNKDLLNSLTKEEKAFLETHPVIKVANQEAWPPFDYVEDSIPKGYCIEHIQLLADKLGLKLEFVSDYQWVNLFELFKEKKIDVMPILYKNIKREPFTLYTEPYIKTTLNLYSIEDNTHLNSIYDLKEGIKVGIHQGDASIPYLKNKFPNIELVELPGSKEIIKALASRKVDAVVENAFIFHHNVKQYQVYNLKLVDFIEPQNSNLNPSLHIGVRKDLPILHSILQKAMHSVSDEEKLMLEKKWLGDITRIHKELILSEEEKAYLAQKESIKICVDPYRMPFEQIDESGELNGISAEIIQMLSEIINKPIELVPTESWPETIESIKSNNCDIIPLIINSSKRSEYMNFTKPYITETLVIATKEDEFFIQGSSELKNRKIGVVEGHIYFNLLRQRQPSIDIITVKSAKEGLEKVEKGELFGFVDILPTIAYNIQQNGMLNLKVCGRLEFDAEFCLASRKDEPLLNSIMQKALEHINKEQINAIVGKWVSIKVEQSFDYTKLIYISVFFLSILLVIILKNRSIKKINRELSKEVRKHKETSKELLLANTEKDKFLSIIAHDLRGPIGTISNLLNVINFKDISPELLSELQSTAQNTYELTQNLLTWAMAQKKQIEINPVSINIQEQFKHIVAPLKYSAKQKNINIQILGEEKETFVFSDLPSIKTVIRNLVSNAIKFTTEGGDIKLSANTTDKKVKISISDTGVGIATDKLPQLFKVGSNITSPGTMDEHGTGLGLLLCKEFVELNGGEIGVESKLGEGTTFWFTLSASSKIDKENLLVLIKEKQLKTLIIEDSFLNLQNTINELNDAGINYDVADNGEKGIEKGLEKEYDFILMDINLPKKNGIEVNKAIRNKYPSAIIIALSSYGQTEIQRIDNSIFFNDYLKKPLKIDNLLYCLRKLNYV